MKIDDLKPDPRNPRRISNEALDGLRASIRELGDVSGITFNARTKTLVAGHQRVEALKREFGEALVMEGDVIITPRGDRFPVRVVDWDEGKAKLALLVANNPHIMGSFTEDAPIILDEIKVEFPEWSEEMRLPELTESLLDEVVEPGQTATEDQTYTNKIVAPVYEPKGEKPPVSALFDHAKTESLLAGIEAANLPAEVAHFLRLAAERHTVFNFRQIAEFYCHADAKTQDLMERSGLVIIDFKKAIEYGFVHLTERLGALADLEEADHADA